MDPNRRKLLHLRVLTGACSFVGGKLTARAGGVWDLAAPGAYQRKADLIRHLFVAKKAAGPGDWLAQHREPGQTFTVG